MMAGRERIIDLDGPLRIVEYGDGHGPAFVCVHGLGGSALDWQMLAPRLAGRGRVVALDLPGFGDTPLGGRTTSVADLQRLLDGFLDRYAAAPVVLIGNSMGGMVTLLQAAARPASTEGLVLLAPVLPVTARRLPHPLTTAQFLAYALPPLGEWYIRARRRNVDPRTMVNASLAFLTAHPELVPDTIYEQRTALATRLAAGADADRALLSAARSLLRELALPAYRRAIRSVVAPTLVVHGDRDRLVSVRAALAVAARRPDWTMRVLPDVGHVPQLEAVDAVVAAIDEWMREPQPAANFGGLA